jgi:hypothetical protein
LAGGGLGVETNENLAEKHWRAIWKREVSVGRGDYDLKAEKLSIVREAVPAK